MDYTQYHAASTDNLILPQLDRQNQLQGDTRSKKAPLGPSTPAPDCVKSRQKRGRGCKKTKSI